MATQKPRLRVTVDDELLDLIIDFQTRNGYPDRSMALEALLHAGIEALKHEEDPTPKVHRRTKRQKEERDEEREVYQREETKNDDLVGG